MEDVNVERGCNRGGIFHSSAIFLMNVVPCVADSRRLEVCPPSLRHDLVKWISICSAYLVSRLHHFIDDGDISYGKNERKLDLRHLLPKALELQNITRSLLCKALYHCSPPATTTAATTTLRLLLYAPRPFLTSSLDIPRLRNI